MRHTVALFAVLAFFSGCSTDTPTPKELTEPEVRSQATVFANDFLKTKRFTDIEGNQHPYEVLTPDTWRVVEKQGDRWILKIDPPDGIYVTVSVGADGTDPRMEAFGFAPL